MEESIKNLETYGYIFLFLYSMGSGYVGIIGASVLSSLGKMDLIVSIIVAGAGNMLGTSALVYLARYQKKEVLKYFKKHKRKLALAYIWLKKYDSWLILFNKYIYGVKAIIPLCIGFSKYNLKKFLVLNLISSIVWATSIGIAGFFASKFIQKMLNILKDSPFIPPIVVGAIFLIIWIIMVRVSKKKGR